MRGQKIVIITAGGDESFIPNFDKVVINFTVIGKACNNELHGSRILPQKQTDPQLFKKFLAFFGTEGSFPFSQEPATCPCPEPH